MQRAGLRQELYELRLMGLDQLVGLQKKSCPAIYAHFVITTALAEPLGYGPTICVAHAT